MKIFDTHAHYDDDRFNEDREELLKDLNKNGVMYIVNCGASYDGLEDSFKLSQKYPFVYAAVGIHPSNADEYNEKVEERIKELIKDEKVIAIGEIGLDYYWEDNPSKEVQMDILQKQYKIAREENMPVILHVRDAYADMMPFLRENKDVKAVLHSFSGSLEIAKELVKLGYVFGIGGVVTFKNAKKLVEVVKEIPLENFIVETDAPYLTAEPNRGKRNRSDYIENVIKKIAEIKEMDTSYVEEIVFNNAKKFFSL